MPNNYQKGLFSIYDVDQRYSQPQQEEKGLEIHGSSGIPLENPTRPEKDPPPSPIGPTSQKRDKGKSVLFLLNSHQK